MFLLFSESALQDWHCILFYVTESTTQSTCTFVKVYTIVLISPFTAIKLRLEEHNTTNNPLEGLTCGSLSAQTLYTEPASKMVSLILCHQTITCQHLHYILNSWASRKKQLNSLLVEIDFLAWSLIGLCESAESLRSHVQKLISYFWY